MEFKANSTSGNHQTYFVKDVTLKAAKLRPRELHNNEVLWQQMTQKYLDDRQNSMKEIQSSTITTSYRRDYAKEVISSMPIDVHQFPLYGSCGAGEGETRVVVGTDSFNGAVAISFWNCSDMIRAKGNFKQFRPMTKPNGECFDEQFR